MGAAWRSRLWNPLLALGLLAGCNPTTIDFDLILPRASDGLLTDVGCYRLYADRGDEHDRLEWANDPYDLRLDDLTPGTYTIRFEAVERPLDGCIGGDVRAQAATFGVRIDADREARVPLVLLPVDRPVTLDVPDWVEDWFADRVSLAAAIAVDASGVPRVIFAGGRTPDGPSADVLRYEPRLARFSRMPDLACARVGAAAIPFGVPGEAEGVLFAGGDGDTCAGTSELLDPESGLSTTALLAVPVERPHAVRDGASAWLLGSSTEEAIVQNFSRASAGFEWGRASQSSVIPQIGGAFTPISPDDATPFLIAGGSFHDEPVQTVSLLEPDRGAPGPTLVPCALEPGVAPVSGNTLVAAPTWNGDVLFAGDATAPDRWYRQKFLGADACGVIPGYVQGSLTTSRVHVRDGTDEPVGPLATPLSRGRVLLSGGDDAGTMEIYRGDLGTTLGLGGASGRRDGHVAVVLEDGSVLLAGGGPREVDALLARADDAHVLKWDHTADREPLLDVVVVVSSHEEASGLRQLLRSGGWFNPEGGLRTSGGPLGVAAAIPPLTSDLELNGELNIQVVVTTGDMRCEGREDSDPGEGGQPQPCDLETSSKAEEVACSLDEIDPSGACVAQELLNAVQEAAAGPTLRGHANRPLIVLIAATRDDCSASAAGEVFEPGEAPLVERCADPGADLLDPDVVAETLRGLREPGMVSVMTFGGPDEDEPRDGAPVEACPGVRRTPRLAALSGAMGAWGKHIDLCTEQRAQHPPLQWWEELVDGRLGRQVCLPHLPASPASCVVTYTDRGEGVHEAVRIDEGANGWSLRLGPDTPCENGALVVSPRTELPIGVPVGYACQ